jgi:hypothetical protein
VYPFPDKGIELSDTAGCSPFIPTLQTQSLAPYYEWNFGDGTIELSGNRVEHIFVNETGSPKTFPITLKFLLIKDAKHYLQLKFVYIPVLMLNL